MGDGVRFNDNEGRLVVLTCSMEPLDPAIDSLATPDDMARAYHAMTDEQAKEMALAYRMLPRREGSRSFDESFVAEIHRLEKRVSELEKELASAEKYSADLESVGLAELMRHGETKERLSELTRLATAVVEAVGVDEMSAAHGALSAHLRGPANEGGLSDE